MINPVFFVCISCANRVREHEKSRFLPTVIKRKTPIYQRFGKYRTVKYAGEWIRTITV